MRVLLLSGLALAWLSAQPLAAPAASTCGTGAEPCYLQAGRSAGKRKLHGKRALRRAKTRWHEGAPIDPTPSYRFQQSPTYGCNVAGCD